MGKAKKEIAGVKQLQVPIGKANPAPPIGPALGQMGLNIMEFCKQFNALKFEFLENGQTKQFEAGAPIKVIITAFKDKSFVFNTNKAPSVSYLIRKEIGLEKGSSNPGKDSAGKVTRAQLEAVARKKMVDMNSSDFQACVKMVSGTAISMGLEVVG